MKVKPKPYLLFLILIVFIECGKNSTPIVMVPEVESYIFSISENIIDKNHSILWFSTENGGLNKLVIKKNDSSKDFKFEKN